jgi:hypothetical protein
MTVELVSDTFAPHVGTSFTGAPSLGGEPIELDLTSCEESGHGEREQWEQSIGHVPFSLEFEADGPPLAQQIFALRHPEVGELELFLVPLGHKDGRSRYEAVVS